MAAIDRMSPLGSPAGMARRAGVRRVNNLPLYIAIAAVAVFLLIMVLVAADRAARQNRPAEPRIEKAGSSAAFAQEIAGARKDGIIQAQHRPPPEVPAPLSIDIARPDNLDAPPRPPQATGAAAINEDAQRVHMLKLQQLEEAIKAKTGVRMEAARSAGSAPARSGAGTSREQALARLAAARQQIDAQAQGDPTAAYQARLQQLQRGGAAGAAPNDAGGASGYAAFQPQGAGGDRWQLDAQPETPRSPYLLRAGFVLPAMLISGINSDLPGQIVAQVSQDVFDTATGKWKLIPQGARLVGQYANEVAYGQSRVLVAWQRIVFPDGKAMDIGAMPGADGAGQAGFKDRVNNRYVRLFGSALLMSGVTAGIALSQRDTPSPFGSAPTINSALSEALGQQLGQATAQMIAKNMGIAPTLEIRPGYRFNVVVTKDMSFPHPYQAFDY
ncbi:MAG: TrbI/VirB10 family protein [Comamonas sp.]